MRGSRQSQQLAKQLLSVSFGPDGAISAEQVTGVLAYLEKHPPAAPRRVLEIYHRLVSREIAKRRAQVEHAGPVADATLRAIEASLSRRYQRPITATAKGNSTLLAGLRIRVADDVYESSAASQLAALGAR